MPTAATRSVRVRVASAPSPSNCGVDRCGSANEYLASVGRVDRLAERPEITGRQDQAVGRVDQILHAGVLAYDQRDPTGERLCGGVGEAVLVARMDVEARGAQMGEGVTRAAADARVLGARGLDEPSHAPRGPASDKDETHCRVR